MSIEYCLGNVDAAARRRLRSRPDVREATCLEQCGRCHAGPFLVVDGEVIDGGDVDDEAGDRSDGVNGNGDAPVDDRADGNADDGTTGGHATLLAAAGER